jgi:AcrR family transcriptional regulator
MARVADPKAKIALLSAAEAVFAEKGVDAAKVEDITRRARLSKGAFYLHFESKEEALRQICESFLARCNDAFRPPEEMALELPSDPAEHLAFWLDKDLGIYELLWQNRATVAILQTCQGPHQYLLQAFHDRVKQTSRAWIEFWKRRGLFRSDVDAELTSVLIFGAYNELARKMLSSAKRPPIEEWLRQSQTMFVRGLGTRSYIEALERLSRARPTNPSPGVTKGVEAPAPLRRRAR